MIVYLTRVIPAFVMYCVNGASRSSLLIESTDSMIYIYNANYILYLYLCEVINHVFGALVGQYHVFPVQGGQVVAKPF